MELANRLLLGRLFCACNLILLGTQLPRQTVRRFT